jgi:hypothetical protein
MGKFIKRAFRFASDGIENCFAVSPQVPSVLKHYDIRG